MPPPSAPPSLQRQLVSTRRWLMTHRWLRLHAALIALCCLTCLWMLGAWMRHAGLQSLALRYAMGLAVCYAVYLGLLRLWAAYLLSREEGDAGDVVDGLDAFSSLRPSGSAEGAELAGDVAGGVCEAASGLDEGAILLLPLLAALGMALALAALLGAGVSLLFGIEALLAVSVEVALSAFAAGLAWRHQRQFDRGGWLRCALAHTWRGALMLWCLGVALGAALDHWLPAAHSLPHAVQLLSGR
jgi:hypothetical protein